jgi:hypothetical protein
MERNPMTGSIISWIASSGPLIPVVLGLAAAMAVAGIERWKGRNEGTQENLDRKIMAAVTRKRGGSRHPRKLDPAHVRASSSQDR